MVTFSDEAPRTAAPAGGRRGSARAPARLRSASASRGRVRTRNRDAARRDLVAPVGAGGRHAARRCSTDHVGAARRTLPAVHEDEDEARSSNSDQQRVFVPSLRCAAVILRATRCRRAAYVFGNTIGQRVKSAPPSMVTRPSLNRTATYQRTGQVRIWTPASRAALGPRSISTFTTCDAKPAHVGWTPVSRSRRFSEWLGHSNISQTSTYLAGTPSGEPRSDGGGSRTSAALCKNLQRVPRQGGESRCRRLRGLTEGPTKPWSNVNGPSCDPAYEPGGRRFESCRAHHFSSEIQ